MTSTRKLGLSPIDSARLMYRLWFVRGEFGSTINTGTDASGAIVKLLTSSSVSESGVMLIEALVGAFGTGIDVNAT